MNGTAPVVVLARHGRTPWHSPNRYTGRSDVPLDAEGERQADVLARWAAARQAATESGAAQRPAGGSGFAVLACSDLRRAMDTARPVAAATGLAARVDHRLRELDFGMAEGLTLAQVRAIDPEAARRFTDDPVTHHFPGGEHPEHALERFHAGLVEAAKAADGTGPVLVVAHSTMIRLVVAAAVGIPLRDYRRRLPGLDPTGTTTLRLDERGRPAALLAYNVPVTPGWRA